MKKKFTSNTIEKVRKAAEFKCCVCRSRPCFHTHHLDPEGGNDFDNAAPLCVTCHDLYGKDPLKQKFIRQARNDLYKCVEETRSTRKKEIELNKEILEKVEELKSKTITKKEFFDDVVPKIVNTIYDIGNEAKKYAKNKDYEGLVQSLCSLGSSATYISGQIHSVSEGTDEKNYEKILLHYPLLGPPHGAALLGFCCPHCFQLITDPSIDSGSQCPFCKEII